MVRSQRRRVRQGLSIGSAFDRLRRALRTVRRLVGTGTMAGATLLDESPRLRGRPVRHGGEALRRGVKIRPASTSGLDAHQLLMLVCHEIHIIERGDASLETWC